METDYQKVYNNLTTLLQDICQFLSSDKMGFLSHRDKKLVESLITRAKVQLQEISKIEKLSTAEEYVDMDANKVPTDEEDDKKTEIYSSADDINKHSGHVFKESVSYTGDVNKNPGNIIQVTCPYIDIPARNASQNVKYGFISMKKKFLLFEKLRRVYATIHNNWLLIYYTEKDNKPHCTFFLKHYEAKETEGPKSTSFELISTFDRKSCFFTALTPKDMVQWVVNINRCHDKVIVQGKELGLDDSVSLEEDDGEHYDIIMPGTENRNSGVEEEEDDIYLELDELVQPSQNNNRTPQKVIEDNTGPPLPGRPQRGLFLPVSLPLKAITPVTGSDSSLASYDDISDLVKQPNQNVDGASSEENDDETYDIFVNVKENIKKMSTALPENNKQNEDTNDRPKDKIKIYQSNSPTIQKNIVELEEGFRNKSKSFIQEMITKKSNTLLKPIKANNENRSSISESTNDMMKQSDQDVDGSVSEDDGDETYDMFVNVKQKITKMSTKLPKNGKENAKLTIPLTEEIAKGNDSESISKKKKINLWQLNSATVQSHMEIDEGFRSKTHSCNHDLTRSTLKVPLDLESTTTRIVNKEHTLPVSESKELKYDTNDTIKQPEQSVGGVSSEEDGDETYMFVNVNQKISKMSSPLPKINKKPQEKITNENTETMSMKGKIGIYQSNSPTVQKNIMEIEEGFRNKSHSFMHQITKKSNSSLKLPISPEPTLNLITNKEHTSPTSESKDFKYCSNDMNKSPASASKKFKVDTEMGNNDLKSDLKDFETDTKTDDPKPCKWPGGLNPPVVKKVPAVPLKPIIRDKPFIGKRPLYGGIRQVTNDHDQ